MNLSYNNKKGFFSFDEAEDNYKWLVKFVYDNKIPMDDDFIFEGMKYLNDNSNIFTEDLKNNYFPPEPPQVTDPIECPYPISQFEEMEVEGLVGAVVYTEDADNMYFALVHDIFGHWTLSLQNQFNITE